MSKCGACGKYVSRTDAATCSKCSSQYHRACVGVPDIGKINPSWICPECKRHIPRDNKAETPVKKPSVTLSPEKKSPFASPSTQSSSGEQQTSNAPVDLAQEIRFIREEMQSVRGEIRQISVEITDFKNIFQSQNQRLDELTNRVDILEQRVAAENPQELVNRLEGTIQQLTRELNEKDQDMLCNDLDIANLPETPSENTVHLVSLVAAKLGVTLEEQDIVHAERVGPRRIVTSGSNESVRPRPIAVRVTRRALRDELLKCARVRRGVTSADLGLSSPPRPFYLNERLTRYNRTLFNMARDTAGRAQWKFVWTRRGRVYARKDQGQQAYWIKAESDVARVFKLEVTVNPNL